MKVFPFILGIVAGLGISQNFNHKVIWGNKTNIIFSISKPTSLKDEKEIYDMIQ